MPDSILEKAYYRSPIFLQNLAFSSYGLYLRRKRFWNGFSKNLERLRETEWWSASKIAQFQEQKFVEVVRHAYETVPFYRNLYDLHGVNIDQIKSLADAYKLPTITKVDIKNNLAGLVSAQYSGCRLMRQLTSGTTGTPLTVSLTKQALNLQWAIWWRHKSRFGLCPGDRHLVFGARVPVGVNQRKPPYWRRDYINNRDYLSTYHISRRNARTIADYLNSEEFSFYTGYPSAIYDLAYLLDEKGFEITSRPNWIVSGSDSLVPRYERLISRVFGAPVTEQYGMTEFAGNISKCEKGNFHVDFECGLVEVEGGNAAEGGALILTGWGNPAMPFIRYRIGDAAVPLSGSCDCGRQSFCFSQIEGRLEDYVVTPDGRRVTGMNQVFEYVTNAIEMQVYQEQLDLIEVRVVPGPNFGARDKDEFTREFRRRAGSEMAIKFRMVSSIDRSQSGKIKAVISDVSTEGSLQSS
ncbi:phenylacetate--CoA ligase family protein [Spiribacter roseus]|uniref:phenylacetate--CoA ligase family protein n=1 Tax=Spiribacter roseus TaxID=1855875 RepID=UPI001330732D|nr:hypothetical protein [Spiribacter roseus]